MFALDFNLRRLQDDRGPDKAVDIVELILDLAVAQLGQGDIEIQRELTD